MVTGEDSNDYGDNGGEGHGTHVAGIIAAHGTAPTGVRGIAPAVTLMSYRVFGKQSGDASNFAIAKAIDKAVLDGCDLINLSLGGGDQDEVTHKAIHDARNQGTLAIIAAGNNGRKPVSFPGSDSLAIAVSAFGRKGTYPTGATQEADVELLPKGDNPLEYIAAFSNIGPEISLTGPGCGIISTIPGNGDYMVMDGTSMACPAVTGAISRLLASHPEVLSMPRDQSRSDSMVKLILTTAQARGFGPYYEGRGLVNL